MNRNNYHRIFYDTNNLINRFKCSLVTRIMYLFYKEVKKAREQEERAKTIILLSSFLKTREREVTKKHVSLIVG